MARADELIRLLYMSAATSDGNPDRCHITNLEHNLRVATLAKRHVPDEDEIIFMALVHDFARPLNDVFHGEVIAEMVRDMVSPRVYHVLRTHGAYQSWKIHGEPVDIDFAAPHHALAMKLCGWEFGSFSKDWNLTTMSIDEAEEVIHKICKGRD